MAEEVELPKNPTVSADLHYVDLRQRPVSVKGLGAVVIRDCFNNPVVVVRSYPSGHVLICTVDQPDFNLQLAEVGILQRVEVENIPCPKV